MYPRLACFVFLMFALLGVVHAKNVSTIYVEAGFSVPVQLPEPASTIAIGNQEIISTSTLKPDLIIVNGQAAGATSITVFGRSGKLYEYRVQVGNDITQLRSMIRSLEKNVTVEDLNGTIVLKGTVANPTALIRVLTLADRFVTGNNSLPDFSVISDRGGVLSGNLQEYETGVNEEISGVSPDPRLSIPTIPLAGGAGAGGAGGGGAGAGGGGAGGGGLRGGGVAGALRQPLMPIKGNLAQNISRGEIVVVGNGRVMSLIKVAKQPKVEIQMQIIGIDRNKTDSYGLDWRLDTQSNGRVVTVGSVMGDVSPSGGNSPDQLANNGFDPGNSSIFAFVNNPGKYALSAFMRFLQQKGAAKTLSNPLVTAVSGESASFLVGGNIPIPVQTQTVNQVTATTATNVRFIQFGLKLIVRPTVLENGKISIVLDQSISEPDYSQSITLLGARIPGFNQRSVSTLTESASGETWAVAGLLSEENTRNLSQIPWLSKVPVLGWLFKNSSDAKTRNELMILVNARVIEGDNNTKTSFESEGDLAPSNNGGNTEQDNIPLPEESGQLNKSVNVNEEPRKSRLNTGNTNDQVRSLDLPEVIAPPVNRAPKKPKYKEQPPAETGESYISQDSLAIYSPVIKDLLSRPLPRAGQERQVVATSAKLIGIEGKLISYEEFPNPVFANNEQIQSPAENKHDADGTVADINQYGLTTVNQFSDMHFKNDQLHFEMSNNSACSGFSPNHLGTGSTLADNWMAGLIFTPIHAKIMNDSDGTHTAPIFAQGFEALSAKK